MPLSDVYISLMIESRLSSCPPPPAACAFQLCAISSPAQHSAPYTMGGFIAFVHFVFHFVGILSHIITIIFIMTSIETALVGIYCFILFM